MHGMRHEHAEEMRLLRAKMERECEELLEAKRREWERETDRRIASVRQDEVIRIPIPATRACASRACLCTAHAHTKTRTHT
jgi:hypothetical protein